MPHCIERTATIPSAKRHYGIGVAPYSPVARGLLTGKYLPGAPLPEGSRAARGDRRMLETELRTESYVIAQKLGEHAERTDRTLLQFALAWLWANQIVTSVIAGPRTLEQWQDYVNAIGTPWSDEDEALVNSLVAPGHPSTPATAIRSIRSTVACSTSPPRTAISSPART